MDYKNLKFELDCCARDLAQKVHQIQNTLEVDKKARSEARHTLKIAQEELGSMIIDNPESIASILKLSAEEKISLYYCLNKIKTTEPEKQEIIEQRLDKNPQVVSSINYNDVDTVVFYQYNSKRNSEFRLYESYSKPKSETKFGDSLKNREVIRLGFLLFTQKITSENCNEQIYKDTSTKNQEIGVYGEGDSFRLKQQFELDDKLYTINSEFYLVCELEIDGINYWIYGNNKNKNRTMQTPITKNSRESLTFGISES